jgi:hypothetical protein
MHSMKTNTASRSIASKALLFGLMAGIAASSCAQGRFTDLRFADSNGKRWKLDLVRGKRSAEAGEAGIISDGDRFDFPKTAPLTGDASLVIEYRAEGVERARIELVTADSRGRKEIEKWELCLSSKPISFYAPLKAGRTPVEIEFGVDSKKGALRIEGMRVAIGGFFYGIELSSQRISIGPGCSINPVKGGGRRLALSLNDISPGWYSLAVGYRSAKGKALLSGLPRNTTLLPESVGTPVSLPVRISGYASFGLEMPDSFTLDSFRLIAADSGPIPADPMMVANWRENDFREGGYELFRWDSFPDIIILLFADYAEQDRMLKRLAFYAEKTGFRGRLATDREIAGLHGWNAHDYPAQTLARFFSLAESEKFPLGAREIELRDILLKNGVIKKDKDGWSEGKGAIISISLESSPALRKRFMAHEGYHGIYFTDADFRKKVKAVWEGVSPDLKEYILEFFDFKELDVTDPELMSNEFASYFLQTPAEETPEYFSGTVADFLEADRKGGGKYRRFSKAHEGEILSLAEELDAIVKNGYSLASGRVWRSE